MIKFNLRFIYYLTCLFIVIAGSSCNSLHQIEKIPEDTYLISAAQYNKLDPASKLVTGQKNIQIEVDQSDTVLKIVPVVKEFKPLELKLDNIDQIKLHRYTFDIDVLAVPFKIRPSVEGFPAQLDANFDAALYIGRRRDNYSIKKTKSRRSSKTHISGEGYGYGAFVGIGAVAMNPYVTRQLINYEYSGLVFNGGIAGIYDAKRFNIGLAIGADILMDKNRNNWIYQGKPWIGVLFGIDLN